MEMAAAEARLLEALVARRTLLRKFMKVVEARILEAVEARNLEAAEARMERVSNRGMELDR